jgi:hypothetical protein
VSAAQTPSSDILFHPWLSDLWPAQAHSRRRPQLLPAHTRPRVGSGTRGHLHCVPFGPAVSNPRECSRSARRSDPTPGPKDKVQMRWALGIIIKRQRTDLTPAARSGFLPVNQNTRRARTGGSRSPSAIFLSGNGDVASGYLTQVSGLVAGTTYLHFVPVHVSALAFHSGLPPAVSGRAR